LAVPSAVNVARVARVVVAAGALAHFDQLGVRIVPVLPPREQVGLTPEKRRRFDDPDLRIVAPLRPCKIESFNEALDHGIVGVIASNDSRDSRPSQQDSRIKSTHDSSEKFRSLP